MPPIIKKTFKNLASTSINRYIHTHINTQSWCIRKIQSRNPIISFNQTHTHTHLTIPVSNDSYPLLLMINFIFLFLLTIWINDWSKWAKKNDNKNSKRFTSVYIIIIIVDVMMMIVSMSHDDDDDNEDVKDSFYFALR